MSFNNQFSTKFLKDVDLNNLLFEELKGSVDKKEVILALIKILRDYKDNRAQGLEDLIKQLGGPEAEEILKNTPPAGMPQKESSTGVGSVTGAEGAYLTKARVKKTPTSGYKNVTGFRKGHTKLNFIEPKDLWDLNENRFEKMYYKDGTEIKVGDKVNIIDTFDDKGYGDVTGFEYNDKDKTQVVLVNVRKGGGSTNIRSNMPFFADKLEKQTDDKEESVNENIKYEIKNRNTTQQFHEVAKLANKNLEKINKMLEYALQLKSDIHEDNVKQSVHTSRLMEKARKKIVSAYNKMKKLAE